MRSCPIHPKGAAAFVPDTRSLPQLARAVQSCKGCELYCNATQAVFGEGPRAARLMVVGEVPGDQEDRQGRPFVGSSGRLLQQVLHEVGLERKDFYLTNAVKHFKFEPRGKRRLHKTPSAREVNACRPWLEAEIRAIRPEMIVCLGATAAKALMGNHFRITKSRGQIITDQSWAKWMLATYHPSALLRAPDEATARRMRSEFVRDLLLTVRRMRRIRGGVLAT